jgi:antirestriction protein ArdC
MNIYEETTNKVLELLKQGTVPWRQEWTNGGPMNLVSKKDYKGWNFFSLYIEGVVKGYKTPYWLTYNQATQLKGFVKKGEKASDVIYWQVKDYADVNDKDKEGKPKMKRYAILKEYKVFNIEQCENIPQPKRNEFKDIIACNTIVEKYKDHPEIKHSSLSGAYYYEKDDVINMLFKGQFDLPEEYYSTLFHELTHSTGSKSRLDRLSKPGYEYNHKEGRGKEEMVDEFGSAFLCAMTGVSNKTINNSASYISGWSKAIKEDPHLIIESAGKAQKAVKLITGI